MLCGGEDDDSSEDTDDSKDELEVARENGVAVSNGILRNKVSRAPIAEVRRH